jgi:hypothetical protein
LYPAFNDPDTFHLFNDQFAFRPTGSTEAALISILQHVTLLLANYPYVRLIALDFSKAFDTCCHHTIFNKLSVLPVDDFVYNWFVNYFDNHIHVTKFNGEISNTETINASVFQGSAVGPPMFVINGIDLKPINKNNFIDKYADDTYLIVPSCNDDTVDSELQAIERWASSSNLKLNKKKITRNYNFL